MKDESLSSKIKEIGMELAEEEQKSILKKYGLAELNQKQIDGIVE